MPKNQMQTNSERFSHIDFLRAICIIGVILTHILSYNLHGGGENIVWNYLHFVVVGFVFCSGYVLFARYQHAFSSVGSIIMWYKKRFIRLVIPFYFYLFCHYSLWFLFPQVFHGLEISKSVSFIVQSILLIGGVNLNWLVLLFLQLTLLFPFLVIGKEKKSFLLYVYLLFAFLVTIGCTIWQFPYSYYRYSMFFAWTLVLCSSFLFFEKKLSLIKVFLVSSISFVVLFWIFSYLHRSLTLIDHKYPPDFFYLSYASTLTTIIIFVSNAPFLQKAWVKNIYTFLSREAYGLYFIHYIVMDSVLTAKENLFFLQNIFIQIIVVFCFSICISFLLKKAKLLFH